MQDDTKTIGKYTFFWKTGSPFSQWHPSEFVPTSFFSPQKYSLPADFKFKNAEQYMMYRKADHFHDDEIASEILRCDNPRDMKALGRKVSGFDTKEWDLVKRDMVTVANILKFGQNRSLLKRLTDTGDTILVEASPYDKIWGIGLTMEDPRALDETKWQGENLLGKVLMHVREQLK